jgi:hypothetical protein
MYSKIRRKGGVRVEYWGVYSGNSSSLLFVESLWGGVYVALLCTRHCRRGLDIYEDE